MCPSFFENLKEEVKPMKDIIHLKNPLEINGKKYTELSYDWDEITPDMFNRASALSSLSGRQAGDGANANIMELDSALHMYLGMMAIIAINPEIDIQDLKRVKGMDVVSIVRIGRNFISRSAVESSGESNSDEPSDGTPEPSMPESKK